MVKRRLVRVFSFIAILALVFAMASAPAYAISKQQFGAWIASALTAANIVVSSVAAPVANLVYYLSDPYNVTYQIGEQYIQAYMDRSTISIDKDKVNIDGTWYSDIWLSHDAAEAFRINANDFKTALALASESSGTFASGVGNIAGIPMYLVNGQQVSQKYQCIGTGSAGSVNVISVTPDGNYQFKNQVTYPDGWTNSRNWNTIPHFYIQASFYNHHPYVGFSKSDASGNGINVFSHQLADSYFDNTPFTFDYVAGEIPANEPLPSDVGMRVRVPTTVINQWYVDYPDTPTSVTYNFNDVDPTLPQKIDDLIDLIVPIIPVIDVDYTEYVAPEPLPDPEPIPEPEPYPVPAPQPGTTIQDTDWTDLFDGIKNIFENVSINNSYIESIKNLGDKIKWGIDDLIEHVTELTDTILHDIEQGPLKIFDKLLDLFKSLFLPFFLPLKIALSIWSYVVSWIDKIFGLWNTFYAILPRDIFTPVFGTFAAFVCISIFKKVIH